MGNPRTRLLDLKDHPPKPDINKSKSCKLICCGPKAVRYDTDGAHCPECDELMEMDLGPVGNPAWFHKTTPRC